MEIIKGRRSVHVATISGLGVSGLTGYSAQLVMAVEPGATPVLIVSGVIANPTIPEIEFTILPADTSNIEASDYYAEVNIWKPGDTTIVFTPVARERVSVMPGIKSNPTS